MRENPNFLSLPRNFFMQNGKVGEVTFFLKKNVFIALVA
jgi:hypothetical protein